MRPKSLGPTTFWGVASGDARDIAKLFLVMHLLFTLAFVMAAARGGKILRFCNRVRRDQCCSASFKLLVFDTLRITIERQVQLDTVLKPCL
jgi:hypothetical protein